MHVREVFTRMDKINLTKISKIRLVCVLNWSDYIFKISM